MMMTLLHTAAFVAAMLQAPAPAPPAPAQLLYALPEPHVVTSQPPRAAARVPAAAQRPERLQERGADRWFGSDKPRHFWVSYAVTAFTFAAAHAAGADTDASLAIALPVAAAAGIGKETYDRRRGGRFSARDLVADALGIAAAYFLLREVR